MNIKILASSPNFSYLISKNPANIFEKSERAGQRIYAKFKTEGDETYYHISIINDPIAFMKKLKELNESSYVNSQVSCVCPYNIAGFFDCLRSAIIGNSKYPSPEMQVEYDTPRLQKASIGPFPDSEEFVVKVFSSFEMEVKSESPANFYAKFYCISGEMKLQEFLQKIYILSYYITRRLDLFSMDKAKIEKFANMMKEWIGQGESKAQGSIIKTLCRGNKGFAEQLINGLDEKDDTEKDEMKDKLRIHFNSLHDKRHDLITEHVKVLCESGNYTKILDYGSGENKLIEKLSKVIPGNIGCYSFEARESKWYKGKNHKRMNLLFPNLEHDMGGRESILILSEVIEHFDAVDRFKLINVITKEIEPGVIILTTPNKEWNKTIELPDTEMRHWDHKIEFFSDQYEKEIVNGLADRGYIKKLSIKLFETEPQPTFMDIFERKA